MGPECFRVRPAFAASIDSAGNKILGSSPSPEQFVVWLSMTPRRTGAPLCAQSGSSRGCTKSLTHTSKIAFAPLTSATKPKPVGNVSIRSPLSPFPRVPKELFCVAYAVREDLQTRRHQPPEFSATISEARAQPNRHMDTACRAGRTRGSALLCRRSVIRKPDLVLFFLDLPAFSCARRSEDCSN